MRIYDLNGRAERQRVSHRVAVIGTCRVYGPFEVLVAFGRAVSIWDDGAMAHSLAETRQLIRYTRGEIDIPKWVRPFIFQPDERPQRTRDDQSILDTVDTFFVELSERRYIVHPPHALNVNHFYNNFVSKYGPVLLPWYRAFAAGTITDDVIESTMAKLVAQDCPEKAWIESILKHTRMQQVGDHEVAVSLDEAEIMLDDIVFDESKQWILVSQFLVPGVGGAQMAERAKGIDLVRELSSRKGFTMFNPTELVEEYGVKAALASEGRDIYHYERKFTPTVADALLKAAGLVAEKEVAVPAAARVNDWLLEVHRKRQAMGINESGLYPHYKRLLDQNLIVGTEVGQLAEVVANKLPPFDEYHVLRAGLGEIAFVLSSLGLTTVGFDPDRRRFEAMRAALEVLGDNDPQIAQRMRVDHAGIPVVPKQRSVLGLAIHLIGYSPDQEDEALTQLAQYDALIIRPEIFLFNRGPGKEQEHLTAKLRVLGFSEVNRVLNGIYYFAKLGASSSLERPL